MIASVNVFVFSMKYVMFGQLFLVCPIYFKSILSQTRWQVAVVVTTYSASVEDMLTMGYF